MKILQYIAIIVIFLECTTALGIWNSFKSLFKKTNKKQAEKEEFNPLVNSYFIPIYFHFSTCMIYKKTS